MQLIRHARIFGAEILRASREHPGSAKVGACLREFSRWHRSLAAGASPLADGEPWVTFASRDFLDGILRPAMSVCEFGIGGSTLFFANRVGRLVSVEHDPAWAQVVRGQMEGRGGAQWNLCLHVPEPDARAAEPDPADPRSYSSSDAAYHGHSFRAYATAIDAFPDASFDVVLVDGRARPSCCLHAMSKVKIGGWLILDNSERPIYDACREMAAKAGWPSTRFFGPGPYNHYFWGTMLWRRPAGNMGETTR